MKKIPLVQILTKFYSRDVMKYVATQWRGSGMLLLLCLSLYVSIFIAYPWSKYAQNTYKEIYQPTLSSLPDMEYNNGHFTFDAEMPVIIKHPLTKEDIFYIDTRSNFSKETPYNYPCIISKDAVIVTGLQLPSAPEHYEFYNMFINTIDLNDDGHSALLFIKQFLSSFSKPEFGPISLTGKELEPYLNRSVQQSYYACFFVSFLGTFFSEIITILIISLIINMMLKRSPTPPKLKTLMRLCVLTYIPILLVRGVFKYFMTMPGIFETIVFSITHIVLFMKAVAVTAEDQKNNADTNSL